MSEPQQEGKLKMTAEEYRVHGYRRRNKSDEKTNLAVTTEWVPIELSICVDGDGNPIKIQEAKHL